MNRVMLISETKEINFLVIAKLSLVLTKAGIFGIVVVDLGYMRISKFIFILFAIVITTSRDLAQSSLCLNTPTFSPLLVSIPVFQKCYADLNNDNQLDFIMPSYGGGGSSVTIVLSNGINQYQSYVSYSCSLNPYHVESDDFNTDGNMDIMCVSYDSSKVLILNGNGAGTFTSSLKYAVTSNPLNARCKDLNSDGKVDIVVASSNSISVLINNGSGGFLGAVNYPTTLLDPRLILSDFDNDSKTDVFIYHNSNSRMLKNLGNGTFQSINSNTYNFNYQSNFMDANQVLSFDLNNDNKMDRSYRDICT